MVSCLYTCNIGNLQWKAIGSNMQSTDTPPIGSLPVNASVASSFRRDRQMARFNPDKCRELQKLPLLKGIETYVALCTDDCGKNVMDVLVI